MENPVEDPRIRTNYIDIYFSDETKISWEFLRRNTTYQTDYELHMNWYRTARYLENYLVDPDGFSTEEKRLLVNEMDNLSRTQYPNPERWGLGEYESPHRRCNEARLSWLSSTGSVGGRIKLRPPRTRGRRRDPMEMVASRTCIITDHGCYTTIAHSSASVTIRSDTPPFPAPSQTLELTMTPTRSLSRQVHDIFDRPPREDFGIEISKARFAKLLRFEWLLRSYDAHVAGYSQRKIAEFLYSPERVETEWSSSEDMRKKIKRLLKRAKFLVEGGYRGLI
jgi:hypothetical protein